MEYTLGTRAYVVGGQIAGEHSGCCWALRGLWDVYGTQRMLRRNHCRHV